MENEVETAAPDTASADDAKVSTRAPKRRAAKKSPARKRARAKRVEEPPKPAGAKLVVFFRHGIAEDPSPDKPDGERSLTTSGHDRTKRAARGLSRVMSPPDAICSSPLLRALQTALWVTKAFGGKARVSTSDALLPEAGPDDVRQLISVAEGTTIVLVGHEPNLSRSLADLLGVPEVRANLRRAGCVAVRLDEEGRGTLEWMLTPRALRSL